MAEYDDHTPWMTGFMESVERAAEGARACWTKRRAAERRQKKSWRPASGHQLQRNGPNFLTSKVFRRSYDENK